jgi:hypothetical protein
MSSDQRSKQRRIALRLLIALSPCVESVLDRSSIP